MTLLTMRSCMRKIQNFTLGLSSLILLSGNTLQANDNTSGCDALVQASATGLAAAMKADDATIKQPQSVTKFTCLGNFFHGVGMDVLTGNLNVASIAQNVMGKVCQQLTDEWQNTIGSAQCGLTVTGINTNFNLGLGGLGGGHFCPSLNIGGGGDTLINASTNTQGHSSWDAQGAQQMPTGYQLIGSHTGISEASE